MANGNKRLYEIIFKARRYGREGFWVWLTEEEMLRIRDRLKAAEEAGVVGDWSIEDLHEIGGSYEKAVAIVEAGGFVEGRFRPPATTQTPYLVRIQYRPTWFGLKRDEPIGFVAWMTRFQEENLENRLKTDDRVEDFEIRDISNEITAQAFNELLKRRGVE